MVSVLVIPEIGIENAVFFNHQLLVRIPHSFQGDQNQSPKRKNNRIFKSTDSLSRAPRFFTGVWIGWQVMAKQAENELFFPNSGAFNTHRNSPKQICKYDKYYALDRTFLEEQFHELQNHMLKENSVPLFSKIMKSLKNVTNSRILKTTFGAHVHEVKTPPIWGCSQGTPEEVESNGHHSDSNLLCLSHFHSLGLQEQEKCFTDLCF